MLHVVLRNVVEERAELRLRPRSENRLAATKGKGAFMQQSKIVFCVLRGLELRVFWKVKRRRTMLLFAEAAFGNTWARRKNQGGVLDGYVRDGFRLASSPLRRGTR